MDLFDGLTWGFENRPQEFAGRADGLSLSDRLQLAGFELMLQGCPAWLYSAPYEAARLIESPGARPSGDLKGAPLSPTSQSRQADPE